MYIYIQKCRCQDNTRAEHINPQNFLNNYNDKETEEILGVHIIGIHAADLIQECANAVSTGTTVRELAMITHTHPTLSEVLDAAFKGAVGMAAH